MAYNGTVFGGPIGGINIGLFAAVGLLNPLLFQLDLSLFGSLGIGALQANLSAQLSAALSASIDISIGISNPLAGFMLALSATASLAAQISLALSLGIPTVSIEASAQLSACASLAANLTLQIGGLELLIQAALAIKLPAIAFLAGLDLSAGPLLVASWENISLSSAGAMLHSDMSDGMSYGPNTIAAHELTYGVMIFTKSPTAWVGLKATLMA